MNSSRKYLYVGVVALLIVIGVSLAYFGITIIGNDTAKNNKVVTGNLELTYTDTTEISLENAFPGDSFTKTISVKNTGTKEVSYNLVWTELTNEITNNELVIEATCKRLNSGGTEEGTCESISQTPISDNIIKKKIPIEVGTTHEYTVKVTFIDTGKLQDYNKNKSFTGKLGISEYKSNSPAPTYCTYDGELTQGAEYVNGQYTYRYMQEGSEPEEDDGLGWSNISEDGWGVQLTNKKSTDPVTSTLCTYINNKPVVSMTWMFAMTLDEEADSPEDMSFNSVDLSSFNTENVTNMSHMFYADGFKSLNLSTFDTSRVTDMSYMLGAHYATSGIDVSNFDTSNVTNMNAMFYANFATSITGIENFDTSKVTDMTDMFRGIKSTTLDLSNFDTSKVTSMYGMFSSCDVETLNISNFATSNVTLMSWMFNGYKGTIIGLSNFNTSNVTDMQRMFAYYEGTTPDLSSFDTSNVTNMSEMFEYYKGTTLDISNFDTSKVTQMGYMFNGSDNLKTIYVSDKFVTSSVTYYDYIFGNCTSLVGGAGTVYNADHMHDKTYARIDGGTSNSGYFTLKQN